MSAATDIAAGWVMIDGRPVFIGGGGRVRSAKGREAARKTREKAKERVKAAREKVKAKAKAAREKARAKARAARAKAKERAAKAKEKAKAKARAAKVKARAKAAAAKERARAATEKAKTKARASKAAGKELPKLPPVPPVPPVTPLTEKTGGMSGRELTEALDRHFGGHEAAITAARATVDQGLKELRTHKHAAVPLPERQRRRKELLERRAELQKAAYEFHESGDKTIAAALKVDNPAGPGEIFVRAAGGGPVPPEVTRASAWLGSVVPAGRVPPGATRPEVHVEPGVRAQFDPTSKRLLAGHRDDPGVYAHEMGHWFEDAVPDGVRIAAHYRDRRAGNDPVRSLNEVTGSRQYRDHEVTREDKFTDPYTGKLYKDAHGHDYATEVTSTAVERLLDRPHALYRLDPDLFAFAVDHLRGTHGR